MEKETRKRNETIRCTLSPQTEKRLLGNLNPPKRKFSNSSKPQRIEHIQHTMLPAPKAAENMSKIASFQAFSKSFNALENEMKSLRQLSCPPGSQKIFDYVAEVHSNITLFENHCKTIAKQKRLKTEVNQKSFNYYKDFVSSYKLFGDRLKIFGTKIHQLYQQALIDSFNIIDECVEAFFEISHKDPQTRAIVIQYKKYCMDSLKSLEKMLSYFISDDTFDALGSDYLSDFAEEAKTFGRFFDKELYPVIAANLPSNLSVDDIMYDFRDNYTQIVPLITSAPKFIDQFENVITLLEASLKELSKVEKEIGDEKILKKKRAKIILPENNFEEEEETEEKEIMENLKKLAKLFKVGIKSDDSKAQIIANIHEEAYQKINEMSEKIKGLEKDLEIPPTTTKEEHKERFNEIRKFKQDLEAKIKEENALFNRNIIYSIKNLIPNCVVDTNLSYTLQVHSVVTQLKDFIGKDKQIDEKLAKEVEEAKEVLSKYGKIEETEPLANTIDKSMEKMKEENQKLLNKLKKSKNEIKATKLQIANAIPSIMDLSEAEIADKPMEELIDSVNGYIKQFTNEIRRSRSSSATTISAYAKSRDSLAKLLNIDAKGLETDEITKDMDNIIGNIKTKRENSVIFQQNVFIFIKKLLNLMQIPSIKEPKPEQEEINRALQQIGNKFDDSDALFAEIIESSPESGIFKDVAEYRNAFILLCSKLINKEMSIKDRYNLSEIKDKSLKRIDYLEKLNAIDLFSDLVKRKRSDPIFTVNDLKKEIIEARQNNIQLEETHKILHSMIAQLSSENVLFSPKSPNLIALNAFTAHLDKLQTDSDASANKIIKDVSNLNSTICKQISAGKFTSATA